MKQIQFRANITGAGKYLPKKVLTNHALEKLVETSDEWIQSRTGIRERRIVQNGEATAEMSTNAIRDLMDKHNLSPEEIDVIIIATITPELLDMSHILCSISTCPQISFHQWWNLISLH